MTNDIIDRMNLGTDNRANLSVMVDVFVNEDNWEICGDVTERDAGGATYYFQKIVKRKAGN